MNFNPPTPEIMKVETRSCKVTVHWNTPKVEDDSYTTKIIFTKLDVDEQKIYEVTDASSSMDYDFYYTVCAWRKAP